jgi:hypothetical protein
VADSAVPEAGHAIDVLIALIVVDHGTLAAYKGAKISSGGFGKRVQKRRNHEQTVVRASRWRSRVGQELFHVMCCFLK